MNDTLQSVTTETNAPAEPVAADSGAPAETLDQLLKEFDSAPKVESPAVTDEVRVPDDLTTEAVYREVVSLKRELTRRERAEIEAVVSQDLETAVNTVKSDLNDLPVNVSDRIVRGMLNDLGANDARFLKAFEARHAAPDTWNRTLKAVAREIRKDIAGGPDRAVSEDRAAAMAAVRGASTTAPKAETPKLHEMSDRDFEAYKRSLGR